MILGNIIHALNLRRLISVLAELRYRQSPETLIQENRQLFLQIQVTTMSTSQQQCKQHVPLCLVFVARAYVIPGLREECM